MKPARRQKYYLIPFNLALLIRRERLYKEFQIWLLLKHWSNGHLEITPRVVARLASSLLCSERTISRAITQLRERNWLGYSCKTHKTYVRGIDAIRIIEQLPGRAAVWFDIERIVSVEAFLTACIESYFIRGQKVRLYGKRAAGGYSKGEPFQPVALPLFYPVALSLYTTFFGIAKSTAARERRIAAAAGYIKIRKAPPIPITINNLSMFLRGWPEMKGRIFQRSGGWFIRQTDEVQTTLLFKRRPRLYKQPY